MTYSRIFVGEEDIKEIVEFWENNPYICDSQSCPIKHTHNAGRYLHNDEYSWIGYHYFFGSNNPPPEIWAALHRINNEYSIQGSSTDDEVVIAFFENHVLLVFDSNGEEEAV